MLSPSCNYYYGNGYFSNVNCTLLEYTDSYANCRLAEVFKRKCPEIDNYILVALIFQNLGSFLMCPTQMSGPFFGLSV